MANEIGVGNVYEEVREKYGWTQPTNREIDAAWTNAINLEGCGAAFSAAIGELIELRRKRTTWYGSEENKLRRAINDYLSQYGA